MTFQFRDFIHLELNCILTIEAWLNLNINFDCRHLELWTAFILILFFIVLNVRNKTESKYSSIVFFLSIVQLCFDLDKKTSTLAYCIAQGSSPQLRDRRL